MCYTQPSPSLDYVLSGLGIQPKHKTAAALYGSWLDARSCSHRLSPFRLRVCWRYSTGMAHQVWLRVAVVVCTQIAIIPQQLSASPVVPHMWLSCVTAMEHTGSEVVQCTHSELVGLWLHGHWSGLSVFCIVRLEVRSQVCSCSVCEEEFMIPRDQQFCRFSVLILVVQDVMAWLRAFGKSASLLDGHGFPSLGTVCARGTPDTDVLSCCYPAFVVAPGEATLYVRVRGYMAMMLRNRQFDFGLDVCVPICYTKHQSNGAVSIHANRGLCRLAL